MTISPCMSSITTKVNTNATFEDQCSPAEDKIPQLDGHRDLDGSQHQQLPVNQAQHDEYACENCHKAFESEHQLNQHSEIHGYGCEECFICYTSKYLVDLHEL